MFEWDAPLTFGGFASLMVLWMIVRVACDVYTEWWKQRQATHRCRVAHDIWLDVCKAAVAEGREFPPQPQGPTWYMP